MKIRINKLFLTFNRAVEEIPFADFTYFYGKMGAGKSSIARLVDFVFGGDLDMTTALQSEFVSAALQLTVNDHSVELVRHRDSNQILASWESSGELFNANVPARSAKGEVIKNTGVEVLSDLLFHLSDIKPPKVRKSRYREESDLARLSLRDLLWYCYLDQDNIDSTFFNLESGSDPYKQRKSQDVLRYIVGYHQEKVAELEAELDEVRQQRVRISEGSKALADALRETGVESTLELESQITEVQESLALVQKKILEIRNEKQVVVTHAIESIRVKARQLSDELAASNDAIAAIQNTIANDRRHLNELQMLGNKFRRTESARAVLKGVEFHSCPRCAQDLPTRKEGDCRVCGQPENANYAAPEISIIEADTRSRSAELSESIERHQSQLSRLRKQSEATSDEKERLDQELNEALQNYDSAYLSNALLLEHEKASLEARVRELTRMRSLSDQVDKLELEAERLLKREQNLRAKLRAERALAEKDSSNLDRLEDLFLDCLLRAKIPGFTADDHVTIRPPHFLPEVTNPKTGDLLLTSFETLGSGGKKTLFKCCFAIALHRLATEIDANLPNLMIIDSPMKNISERENKDAFVGFHNLLYSLASKELSGTQFVLIDKEMTPPTSANGFEFESRHMTPDEKDHPPLIRYYKGH